MQEEAWQGEEDQAPEEGQAEQAGPSPEAHQADHLSPHLSWALLQLAKNESP